MIKITIRFPTKLLWNHIKMMLLQNQLANLYLQACKLRKEILSYYPAIKLYKLKIYFQKQLLTKFSYRKMTLMRKLHLIKILTIKIQIKGNNYKKKLKLYQQKKDIKFQINKISIIQLKQAIEII